MLRRDAIALLLAAAAGPQRAVVLLDARTRRVILAQNSGWIAPPGSTLKPLVFSVLLRARKLDPAEKLPCTGRLTIAGRRFDCTHPPMNTAIDLRTALAYSCNSFTARVAERFEAGELARGLERFAIGRTQPAATREAGQLQALGEERVLVSPLELALAYQQIASGGEQAILDGLKDAVEFGTAQRAAVPRVTVSGKTGSVRTASGARIAWFAGFTPALVVAVMLQGRSGGSDAAPVAAEDAPGSDAMTRALCTALLTVAALRAQTSVKVRVGPETVNLPLERYVATVLAGEVGTFRSEEALKAMAVAARTYAVRLRGRHSAEGYDFCSTTHCQHIELKGIAARLEEAAAATAGEMLWYQGKPAFTCYTRDCGGRTEDGAVVWNVPEPYLKSHEDPYCAAAQWRWQADPQEIVAALRQSDLRSPGAVARVEVVARTPSGRAQTLALEGAGETVRVSASAFRFALGRAFGWNTVPSDRYQIHWPVFEGTGSGHGVGLCQRGADQMGTTGAKYREILAFYFPGTMPGINGRGLSWQRLGGERITLFTTMPAGDGAVLALAERELAAAATRLHAPVPKSVEIHLYPDLDTFRNATGEPGWVAARTDGRRVHLQPAAMLRSRGVLDSTVRHEMLHVVLESQAAAGLPVWFREGLAEYLSGHSGHTRSGEPDPAMRQRASAADARNAYDEAAAAVAQLVARYGEAAVLSWVGSGLPPEVRDARKIQEQRNRK